MSKAHPWPTRKLNELFSLVNGAVFSLTDWSESGLPIIRIQNLNDSSAAYNYFDGVIQDKYYVQFNDLLFSWSGSRGTSFGPYIWCGREALLNQHIFNFKSLSKGITKGFAFIWLEYILKEIENEAHGSAGLVHITKAELSSFDMPIPPLVIQQKICKILSTVDKLIEKTQTLIDKYTTIKQGMMSDLFTRGVDLSSGSDGTSASNPNYGKLRPSYEVAPELYQQTELGWVPKEWEVRRVKKILDRIIDYRGKTPVKTDYGVPLVTAKNVRFGYVDPEPREYIAADAYGFWMTRGIPKKGDVLFTTEAPLANVAQIETNEKIAFAQRMIILQASKCCNSAFLKYLLMSSGFRKGIFSRGSGSTVEGVRQSEFKKVLVKLPKPVFEQGTIVEKVDEVVKKISIETKLNEKYREYKKGLMQDLLTGKVRVN